MKRIIGFAALVVSLTVVSILPSVFTDLIGSPVGRITILDVVAMTFAA